jgi:uncharacterized protein
MPMDLHCDWCFGAPGAGLHVHMENHSLHGHPPGRVFDATLNLRRNEINASSLARALLRFPLSSLRVTTLIYWQALKLILKRAPFFAHPAPSDKQPANHDGTSTHAPAKH